MDVHNHRDCCHNRHDCCNHPADHSLHDYCCNHPDSYYNHPVDGHIRPADEADNHLADRHHCCYNGGDNHLVAGDCNRFAYVVDSHLAALRHHYYNENDSHPAADGHNFHSGCCYIRLEDDYNLLDVADKFAVDVHRLSGHFQSLQDGNCFHFRCCLNGLYYRHADYEYVDVEGVLCHDNCWNSLLPDVSSPHGWSHSVLLTDSESCFLILNPCFLIYFSASRPG